MRSYCDETKSGYMSLTQTKRPINRGEDPEKGQSTRRKEQGKVFKYKDCDIKFSSDKRIRRHCDQDHGQNKEVYGMWPRLPEGWKPHI